MKRRKLLFLSLLVLSSCSSEKAPPVVWEFSTGYPVVTVPVLDGQYALFGSDKLYCVNAVTGQLIWDFLPYGIIKTQPVIYNNKVYFHCGGVYCLDLATGKVQWDFWTDSWGETPIAVSEGLICFMNEGTLYCLNSSTGRKLWTIKTAPINRQPLISGRRILFCDNGALCCADATDGKILWKYALGDQDAWFHCIADAAMIYVSTQKGIQCLDLSTGNRVWIFQIDMVPMQSFVVCEDFVYVAYGKIYCLDKTNGAIQWSYAPPEPMGLPVVSGTCLYARTFRMKLCCVDLKTKEKKWEATAPFGTIASGFLYARSGKARVCCIKLPE